MFHATLEHLKTAYPEQAGYLVKLNNIEERLDRLIERQQNAFRYDPAASHTRLRLSVFNTYSDQDRKHANFLFSHVAPSMYTIYIRAFELDADNNIIFGRNEGILAKHFRAIVVDTPTGVVVWDRDEVLDQNVKFFNHRLKYPNEDAAGNAASRQEPIGSGSSSNNPSSASSVNANPNSNPPNSVPPQYVDDRSFPYGGCDELHINRLGFEECDVHIYFFPEQHQRVYSLSHELYNFMLKNCPESPPLKHRQTTLARVTRAVYNYAFKKRLFLNSDQDEVMLRLDDVLSNLLKTPKQNIRITQIGLYLKNHLLPPKPLKVVHHVRLRGSPQDNERIVDVTMPSSFANSYPRTDSNTDLDVKIAQAECEVVELVHLRNIYSTFSTDPQKFIRSFIENKNHQNFKPFVPESLDYRDHFREPWVHYAIDNYLFSNNRSVHDFITRILDKPFAEWFPTSDHKRDQSKKDTARDNSLNSSLNSSTSHLKTSGS